MSQNMVKASGVRRVVLLAGVGLPFLISLGARAQYPSTATTPPKTPSAAEADRVVVTGSNIPTAEEVTAAPVDTLTTQEINRSGSQEILTVLQKRNPSFTGAGNLGTSNANIASGSTLGGTVISIRGFPTLVLYEGRRVADSAAISVGGFQFTDAGLFPAALISRIEVLKDGASALYGSEAIGGVVNIFTKDDFQGAELGFRYGTTLEGAVAERRGYAIGGVGNETTQITVGMQYYEIDPLFQRQRAYSNPNIGGTINFAGQVVDFSNPTGSPLGASYFQANGITPINYPGPVIANSPFNVGVVPGSFTVAQGFGAITQYYHEATGGQPFSFNLGLRPTSTLDTARTNVIASASHQIFGKQLEIFGNFLYQSADFQSFLNAQPLSTTDAPGSAVIILAGRPGLTNVNAPGYIPGVNNEIFNPFNAQIDPNSNLYVPNRYTNYPRIFDNTNNFYRFLGGIRSQITPDWTFETAAYYSKYDISYVNPNLVKVDQLNAMIAGTAVDASGNPIPPLDFFAINPIGTGPGQVSKTQFETIFGANFRALSSFQRVFDAKLVGFPFELPGGKIGLSLGGEFRQEGFKVADSPEIFAGSVPIANIDVKRDIYSFFGELSVPIVGASMQVPGVYNLEINLAARYDHYEGVSEDAKVPKVSMRYQPIKDLTLRATYSNSFIAPTLYETQGPNSTGFSNGITFGGAPQGQAQVLTGSNPGLTPATAENYSAGFVYSPSFVPGLVITADYFRILEQNIISTLGGNLILQSVNSLGSNSPYANLVAFNNFPGFAGAVPIGPGPNALFGKINKTFYIDTLKNLGATHTEGVDMSVHYTMDLRTFGQFELGVNAIVYTEYEAKTLPHGSPYYNLLGLDAEEGLGAIPDYKLTFLGEYRWQGLTLSLNADYIPKLYNAVGHDPETEDFRTFLQIQDYFALDGRLSYTFVRNEMPGAPAPEPKDSKSMRDGKNAAPAPVPGSTMSIFDRMLNGTTLAVGCNNMLDRTPPFVRGANSNTDLSVYDPYGRFLYFEISKKF